MIDIKPQRERASLRLMKGIAITAILTLLLAAACSSEGGDDGSSRSGTVEFIYAASGVPEGLDIDNNFELEASELADYQQASRLLFYDGRGLADDGCSELPTTENLRPGLAESWEVAPDGSFIDFHLREGVMSAAGNEMTAEDVKWSADRALAGESGIMDFLAFTAADFDKKNPFEVIDERTFRVNIAQPHTLDVSIFQNSPIVLDSTEVKKHATEDDPWATEWVKLNRPDFGPFQIESFDPGRELVFTRNPNYWDDDRRGNIDRLVIRAVPESSTRAQLLRAGEVDYADRLLFSEYESLQDVDGVTVFGCDSANRDDLILNQNDNRFADPQVRQAISMAIDREALVQGPYRGLATPSTTGLGTVYWDPPADATVYEYDPEGARQLLAEAGYPNGFSFEMTISPARPGDHAEAVAIQLQSMLGDIGLDVSLKTIPGATQLSDAFYGSDYEALLYLEPPAIADPYYSLVLYSESSSFQNTYAYSNPRYDELSEEIGRTAPGPERDQLMREISDLIVDDVPIVYLVEDQYNHAFSSDVSGFENVPINSIYVYQLSKNE